MTNDVRSPKEIEELFERLQAKAQRNGKKYRKKDFCKDLGYQHAFRYSKITKPEEEGGHKISPMVNKIMDYLEDSL
jgi:hypothetical protein